jgi:hypothetical protein
MSNLDPSIYPVVNTDAIHDVNEIKTIHHPHIWTNCTFLAGAQLPCVLNHTSVSQQVYSKDSDSDAESSHATADEIIVKMRSRQDFALHSYDTNALFSLDSAESVCKTINERAYQWALERVSEKTRARFLKFGQPMVFEEDMDTFLQIFPLFVSTKVKFTDATDMNGNPTLLVKAAAMKVGQENILAKVVPVLDGGVHYCKLLSPARVIEWIQTDGLRKKMGLNSLKW